MNYAVKLQIGMMGITKKSVHATLLTLNIPEPDPMLATPESVDSSRVSPESGVLAAEVFVLDPSLGNENSPARKQNPSFPKTHSKIICILRF
jgi:hypothetical protein